MLKKIMLILILFNIAAFDVSAESDFKIIQKYIDYDDTIRLYFEGIEEVHHKCKFLLEMKS